MKIYIEEAVFSLLPSFTIFCLEAKMGEFCQSGKRRPKEELANAVKSVQARGRGEVFSPFNPIEPWREAFGRFSTEKGARSSLEALLSSARQGTLRSQSPLEEVEKAVSLYFSVPTTSIDLSKVKGFLGLCLSQGRDPFLGPEGKEGLTREGEICYMDKLGALSRCINWKSSPRVKLTEQSQKALFLCECADKDSRIRTGEAVRDLERKLQLYFGARTKIFALDAGQASKRV